MTEECREEPFCVPGADISTGSKDKLSVMSDYEALVVRFTL